MYDYAIHMYDYAIHMHDYAIHMYDYDHYSYINWVWREAKYNLLGISITLFISVSASPNYS